MMKSLIEFSINIDKYDADRSQPNLFPLLILIRVHNTCNFSFKTKNMRRRYRAILALFLIMAVLPSAFTAEVAVLGDDNLT